MSYITQTAKAVSFFERGLLKESLKIFKTFKSAQDHGKWKQDKRILEIAYEMLSGNEEFYRKIGYDKKQILVESNKIIKKRWQYRKKRKRSANSSNQQCENKGLKEMSMQQTNVELQNSSSGDTSAVLLYQSGTKELKC